MQKIQGIILIIMIVILSGCGSTQPKVAKNDITEKFQFTDLSFNLSEKVKSDIKYHTEEEFTKILTSKVKEGLEQSGLLSEDVSMNTLKIIVDYNRRFIGTDTIPTDSLLPPLMDYKIEIFDNTNLLATITRENLTYTGISMDFKILTGSMRDKTYEIEFMDGLAKKIVSNINNIQR